jgi:hypothetical protein
LNLYFLDAATPGFADQAQFTVGLGYEVTNLFSFSFATGNRLGLFFTHRSVKKKEKLSTKSSK